MRNVVVGIGIAIGLLMLVGMCLEHFNPERVPRDARARCLNNLKQLGITLKQYAEDFGGHYPWREGAADPERAWLDLGILFPVYSSGWHTWFCPASRDRFFKPDFADDEKGNEPLAPRSNRETTSYTYGIDARTGTPTAWTEDAPSSVRLLADKKAGTTVGTPGNPAKLANHRDDGRNVLYLDGHVKWKAGPDALDPDEDDDVIGKPNAPNFKAWWSDPPYYGE